MKKCLQNIGAVCFLALFLPYTITLLINGRQGIHTETELPDREYQVLCQLMEEDITWMSDETLELMAVLYRTEIVRTGTAPDIREASAGIEGDMYSRVYQAVVDTQGQVIRIGETYQELPYHAVSAGSTREGTLLGDSFSHVLSAECPSDLEAEDYFHLCFFSGEELQDALGEAFELSRTVLHRDSSDYVTSVSCGDVQWQGEVFRTILHLPSSCFWMKETEQGIRVTVKGSGHGFGISLYTADQMFRKGAGIQAVLDQFYQDAECITIP